MIKKILLSLLLLNLIGLNNSVLFAREGIQQQELIEAEDEPIVEDPSLEEIVQRIQVINTELENYHSNNNVENNREDYTQLVGQKIMHLISGLAKIDVNLGTLTAESIRADEDIVFLLKEIEQALGNIVITESGTIAQYPIATQQYNLFNQDQLDAVFELLDLKIEDLRYQLEALSSENDNN